MANFALVSFDLINASSSDYLKIRDELRKYGLDKYVLSDQGNNIRLPSTTYTGQFSNVLSTQQLKDWLLTAARLAYVTIGDYFVFTTSGGWSWMGGSNS